MIAVVVAAVLAVFCGLTAPSGARAETMNWKFSSTHPNIVDVKLFDRTLNIVYPGNTKVWSLKDNDTHTVRINCTRGSKICYGASVRGTESSYWGLGLRANHSCSECCFTCGGNDPPTVRLRR